MDGCLDDNELQAFFGGRLSAPRTAIVQTHVDACSLCRHLVAEVAKASTNERVVIKAGKISHAPSGANVPIAPSTRVVVRNRGIGTGTVLLDRYRLERVLGEGGTGVVWEASHVIMRRRVAVKLLKSKDEQAQRRFFREARVTAALKHPHIVQVHDVFIVPETGSPAMVMELLDGQPLTRFMRTKEGSSSKPIALPLDHAARVVVPVVSALRAAHAVGVVHRDLKPENIFIAGIEPSLEDPTVRVKVLDFGLAKLTSAVGDVASTGQLTRTGFVLGTPHYMSPEQVTGDLAIDAATDVWSLGVVLYECLAGARPIEAANLSLILQAVLDSKIVPLGKRAPKVPRAVANLVMEMLSRKPADRPSLAKVHEILSPYAPGPLGLA